MWNLNDINPPESEALQAEREMWDEIASGDRCATDSEAHVEWHLNSGVPMGTPGCPQDACHLDDEPPTDTITWSKLRATERFRATWGVRGPAALVRTGEQVVVSKRDGSTSVVTVGRVVWTDGEIALGAVKRGA